MFYSYIFTITFMLWVLIQLILFIDTTYSLILPLSFNNVIKIYCVQINKDGIYLGNSQHDILNPC